MIDFLIIYTNGQQIHFSCDASITCMSEFIIAPNDQIESCEILGYRPNALEIGIEFV